MSKWCHAGDWHVRTPDGEIVRLNTERGADLVLGLWKHIEELEREFKKRQRGRRRSTQAQEGDEEDT